MSYEALLQTTITYWPPGANTGFGDLTYGEPGPLLARYQSDNTNQQDDDGEEFVSAAVVYTTEQLEHNGWVFNGSSVEANPQDVEGAYRIRRLYTTSNPAGTVVVYKAVLG